MKYRIRVIALMASTSLVATGTSTFAQNAQVAGNDGTVVVVTAQKREQKLQDVPMAITVAGAAQLERQQITTVTDLDRVSPAVTFVDGAPGGGAGIRGIATQSFTPSAEASVGIVVDNVPQGNVNTSNLFDMERVEILRGPQGTLFGQSASAGVINMVTKTPRIGVSSGQILADYASKGTAGSKYGEKVVQGVVNIPIDSHSAIRVSGFANIVEGVESDNAIGGQNRNGDIGGRLRYLNNITDRLKLNIIADYDVQKLDGNTTFVFRSAVTPAVISALATCGITASETNNVSCAEFPSYETHKNGGISAQLDYTFGDYNATSITSFRFRDTGPNSQDIIALRNDQSVISPDGVYPQIYNHDGYGRLRQMSQEFRLVSPEGGAIDWVAGAYLARFTYNTDGSEANPIIVPFAACDTCAPVPGATQSINDTTINHTSSNTAAIFGNLTFHFTTKLTGLLGARLSHETVSDLEVFTETIDLPLSIGTITNYSDVPYSKSASVDNFSARIGLQYKINNDLMAYGTLSRGYKGPQINDTVFGVAPTVVLPEIPTAAELGVKGAIGHVGIDLNLFYTKVRHYQGQVCVFNPGLTCGGSNVPQVISKGVEIDVFGRPLRNLTLNGGFIYNPVTYPSGYTGSDGTDLGGTQMTGAPKYKFTLSADYSFDLPGNYQSFISAETTYKSLIHIYPSALTLFDQKAHWITGGALGVKFPDHQTSLSLYVRNIGNTPDPVNIYPGFGPGDSQQIVGKQGLRVVGVSLDRSF